MSELLGLFGTLDKLDQNNIINKFNNSLLELSYGSNDINKENYELINLNNFILGIGSNNNFSQHNDIIYINVFGSIYNSSEIIELNNCSSNNYLVEIYIKFGFEYLLNQMNGDFVITIFDKSNNKLLIARDRVGLRSLFYRKFNNLFLFSSRLSLINSFTDTNDLNEDFILRYAGYHYRYIDNEPNLSPYKNINQLPAASYLTFNLDDLENSYTNIKCKKWWKLEEKSQFFFNPVNEDELAEEYKSLILDSVKVRYQNSKNPIFTLSGGMDSSTVLASAVKIANKKMPAFSTTYKDKTYDETDEIKSMLNDYVSNWSKNEIDEPDIIHIIDKMLCANDEPVATATWLSHYILSEQIYKSGFKSIFGGLGGDELNAGEYEYFFYNFADILKNNDESQYNHEITKWIEYHDHPIHVKNKKLLEKYLKLSTDLQSDGICKPDINRLDRYSDTLLEPLFSSSKQPKMVNPFNTFLNNRTYQDIYYETVPCSVRAQNRNANYFKLNNFLPFFDHRLIEFMFKVPNNLKIQNGITKHLLRKATKDILPEDTRGRIKKTGWNAPAHLWFVGDGFTIIQDLINSQKFKERGIYNLGKINSLIEEHREITINNLNKDNHMMFFWQLLNLELWMQKNEK